MSTLSDFFFPSELFDIHEQICDALIDGQIGQDCILVYPDKWTECDNCILDFATQRSSGVYKHNGPTSFPANSICPRCGGAGRAQVPVTKTVRMRVYWERKAWEDIGFKVANPDGVAMCIGYMSDLPDIERANKIILNAQLLHNHRYECVRDGESKPYGYRRNRYFVQFVRRTGGGN